MQNLKNKIIQIKLFLIRLFSVANKTAAIANKEFTFLVGQAQASAFKDQALAILKSGLGKIVLSAVASVEALYKNATPAEKHALAYSQIISLAKSQGFEVTESIVNLFISVAVPLIKNKL